MANVQSPSLAGYISLYGFNAINPSDIPNIQYGLEGVFPLATGLGDGDLLKVSSLTMTVYTKLVVPRRRSYVSLVSKLP